MSNAIHAQPSNQPHTAALAPSGSSIKRLSTISKQSAGQGKSGTGDHGAVSPDKGKNALPTSGTTTGLSAMAGKDVVSPGELCGFVSTLLTALAYYPPKYQAAYNQQDWAIVTDFRVVQVDTLLTQLETRFDEMSEQVLGRMNEMSDRIDTLENTIQDLMASGIESNPPTPAPKR